MTRFTAFPLLLVVCLAIPSRSAPPDNHPTEPIPLRSGQPAPKPIAEKPVVRGPDKLLVLRDGHRLVLLDPDGKNERQLAAGREQIYGEARLSPDGKQFAVLAKALQPSSGPPAPEPKLYVRKLDEKAPGTNLGVVCGIFAWSPDSTEIACCNFVDGPDGPEDLTHFVINVKTKEKKPLKLPEGQMLTDWSRDGKYFLTTRFLADKENAGARRASQCLVNRDGTMHKMLTDQKQLCLFGRLSPDGTRVVYQLVTPPKAAKEKPKRDLAVLDIPTGKTTVVADATRNGEIMGYSWSPDGKRIAYTCARSTRASRRRLRIKRLSRASWSATRTARTPRRLPLRRRTARGQSLSAQWTGGDRVHAPGRRLAVNESTGRLVGCASGPHSPHGSRRREMVSDSGARDHTGGVVLAVL